MPEKCPGDLLEGVEGIKDMRMKENVEILNDNKLIINDNESIKERREKIKNANKNTLLGFLKEQGVDGTKIPLIEFDKLLRIMQEDFKLAVQHENNIRQFVEIIKPYKLVVPP